VKSFEKRNLTKSLSSEGLRLSSSGAALLGLIDARKKDFTKLQSNAKSGSALARPTISLRIKSHSKV
jgi:hypothetical protein